MGATFAILRILRQKGFSDEVIATILQEVDDEYNRALAEAKKKLGRVTKKTADEMKRGLARFLSGRGFSFETINSVITELDEEEVY